MKKKKSAGIKRKQIYLKFIKLVNQITFTSYYYKYMSMDENKEFGEKNYKKKTIHSSSLS